MFIEPYRKLKHIFDREENDIMYLIVENSYINKYDICMNCLEHRLCRVHLDYIALSIVEVLK